MKKNSFSKCVSIFVISLILSLFLVNLTYAENESDLVSRRDAEINSSLDLAIIIISIVVVVVVIFFLVDHFAKKKHIERAKKIAKKAKLIVNEATEEESEKQEKSKSIELKSALLKKDLQRKLQLQRLKNKKSKKKLLISEFDESEFLKQNKKHALILENKKKKVFLNLSDLGKEKEIEKRDRSKKKKPNSSLFDKLEDINK